MPRAELVNDRIEMQTDPHRDKLLVRAVPGRRFDTKTRTWWLPVSWASCCALRGVFGDRLEIGPELTEWARHEVETRIGPALKLRGEMALSAPPVWHDSWAEGLYSFQAVGAEFLRVAGRALLADEMGTGKTIQAIAALRALDAERILVVAPNSVKRGWAREFKKWWPRARAVTYRPGKEGKLALSEIEDGTARILIMNWENTWRLSKLAPFGSIKMTDKDKAPKFLNTIDWDAVVADEAHRAKEPTAKQTRALWAIMEHARYRFALTGTPLANSPRDLWSVMHGLSSDDFPAYSAFVDRYGLQSWNAFGGLEVVGLNPVTRDEFFKFFDPRFIRRPKKAVMPWLPDKLPPVQRFCALPAKQKKAYREIEKQMLTELDSGDVAYVTTPLAKVTRLRQIAATYVDVSDAGEWTMIEPSGKLDELDAVLEEAGDEQVVVFAEHVNLLKMASARLEKRDVPHGMIIGDVDEADRDANIQAFGRGELRVMLCGIAAGGEGVDGLQVASTVVFLQRSYSMVKDRQAVDRLHRDGQKNAVEIIDIISEDTIEERIFDVLGEKGERLEEICRDRETLRRLIGG